MIITKEQTGLVVLGRNVKNVIQNIQKLLKGEKII